MKPESVLERVRKCISEVIPSEEDMGENARLKEDAGLDSLSLTAVIVGLEEEFEIQFDDSDLDPGNIVTFHDLTELVRKYV